MADKKQPKQKVSFIKSKVGEALGYRTPDHFKGSTFGGKNVKPAQGKFNPSTFKVQHKG